MDRKELINKYVNFFKSKNHKIIPNSPLIPENDTTILFTTAGMQPLIKFLGGQQHPQGKRLVGVQKCIRTIDIEDIGDTTHHTMFEMLGNWSLGDYFKKEAIEYSFEFLTKILKIPKERLGISIFKGDSNSKIDIESKKYWTKLGIPENKIIFLGNKDNWWGPVGNIGPCGPDTEIFYWKLNNTPIPKKFNPKNKNWIEIWNNVLMGNFKDKNGNINIAKQKNIDTGMGVERTVSILNSFEDNYEADMWKPLIKKIEELSNKKYLENKREMRIIADHIKAACFIINDNIIPSNSEQGYVLRRLLRRAIRNLKKIGVNILKINATTDIAKIVFDIYSDYNFNKDLILFELKRESDKFQKTLDKGLKEFKKMINNNKIDGKSSFLLYQSYGFPIEMIEELSNEKGVKFNPKDFKEELKKHKKLSQTTSAGKFKSGLLNNSKSTIKLHTAAHMLLKSLKIVLGNDINQRGSNINTERLRFDFNFNRKLTDKEKFKIEKIINSEIKKNHTVIREEMSLEEARNQGASGIFDDKYKGKISVYTIGNFSKEICTGPHVKNTKTMGTFKIKSEKSSSSGIRRIKAILE